MKYPWNRLKIINVLLQTDKRRTFTCRKVTESGNVCNYFLGERMSVRLCYFIEKMRTPSVLLKEHVLTDFPLTFRGFLEMGMLWAAGFR